MIASGCCALAIGLTFGGPLLAMIAGGLAWGVSVICDSVQFSASVAGLSEGSLRVTMPTIRTCVGFLITLVSIHLMPYVIDLVGWHYAFSVLAIVPFLGTASMRVLRQTPDAIKLAAGRHREEWEDGMNFEFVKYDRIGPVARIAMSRPERTNALNGNMLSEICEAMDHAELDDTIRAIIVTGAGTAFSSGFDLKEQMERKPSGIAQWRPLLKKDFDTVMRFWRSPKPTIASVRGPCLAGAFELMLACDVTIASDTAFFGEPELKFGAGIVVMILPWLVGPKIAKEIILCGEDRLPVERARELGLVNRIVADTELDAAALAFATHISAIDPDLVQQTKRAINKSIETQGLFEALDAALDIDLLIEGGGSPDKMQFMNIARAEGLKAALVWRDARFAVKAS
jgi:enoyl-CoA hydratase